MTFWRLISSLIAALALGMIIAMLGGRPRQVSVALWMSFAVGWLSWLVVRDLLSLAPVRPDSLKRLRRSRHDVEAVKPRGLTSVEGMLASSSHSPRAATIRLRPRLVSLTDELLRRRHGIETAEHPQRAAAVLGDVAWIVDGNDVMSRSPTPTEVDTLIARAMTPSPTSSSEARENRS